MAIPLLGVKLQSAILCLLYLVTVDGLYLPFGQSSGDSSVMTWHGSVGPFSVDPPFVFYQDTYNGTYANVDGLISFTKTLKSFDVKDPWDSIDVEAMCIFCSGLTPVGANKVWYRLSSNASDIQAIQELARQFEDFGASFTPSWVFVITWDDVGRLFEPEPGNTVQISIATDGQSSLALFDYEVLGWVHESSTNLKVTAKAGFNKGDRNSYYLFPESLTENMTLFTSTSNIDTPGLFLFRVDQATIPEAPTVITTTSASTTTTTAPTTTTMITTTSASTTITTTPTTISTTVTVPTTSTSTTVDSRKRQNSDDIAYGVGFGVLGAAFLSAIIVGVAIKVRASKKQRTIHSSAGTKRKPPPYNYGYDYEEKHCPVRIPKPDYP